MEDFDNPAFDPEEVKEIDRDDDIDVDGPPTERTTTDPSGLRHRCPYNKSFCSQQ